MTRIPRLFKKGTPGYGGSAVLTGIAFFFYGSTRFCFFILLQWRYGSALVGNYNLVLSTAMPAALFITSIFNTCLPKFASEARGRDDMEEFYYIVGIIFRLLLLTAVLSAGAYYLLSDGIAAQFDVQMEDIFKWGAPVILLFCTYHFFKHMYYVLDKVKLYAAMEAAAFVLFFTSLFICLKNRTEHFMLVPMVIQLGFFSLASAVIFFPHLRKINWLRAGAAQRKKFKQRTRELFRYAVITGTGTALSSIAVHIFTIILGKCADVSSVGRFSLVRATLEPAVYLFRIMTTLNIPKISFIYGTGNLVKLVEFFREKSRKLFVLTTLLFLPAILFSPVISRVLFRNETATGAAALIALMLIRHYLQTSGVFHLNFLTATRYPLVPQVISPISLFIQFPFVPVVFAHYGLAGLGGLILVGEILRSTVIVWLGEKKLALMKNSRSNEAKS